MNNEILKSFLAMQRIIKSSDDNIRDLKQESILLSECLNKEIKKSKEIIDKMQNEIKKLKYALNNAESKSDTSTCVICFARQRNVLFRPCNHLVICDTCSGETSFDECIICKNHIDSYEYAYL
jgi:hypothetical protein